MPKEYVNRYRIVREIGSGGMGQVFEAYDPLLRRTIALKVLIKTTTTSQSRFLLEAQSTAKLDHPNIIKLHEINRDEKNQIFYTMDFINGCSLSNIIEYRRISIELACTVIAKIARAIDYAHSKGIIHRDITPGNIVVGTSDNEPKLMDFGLAKELEGEATKFSKTGVIMGTVAYMSPEQIEGKVQTQSDIYSLGAVLYKVLTKRVPFEAENSVTMIYKIMNEDPKRLRQINSRVPKEVEAICSKALAKKITERYQTAGEMADDLENYLKGRPVSVRSSLSAQFLNWLQENKKLAGIYSLFIIILTFLSMMSVFLLFPPQPKKVFLLFSYESDLVWDMQIRSAIMESFEDHFVNIDRHIEIAEYYMETKKYSNPQDIEKKIAIAIEKIKSFQPDLVITMDDSASGQVIPHFFNSPIKFVFCGVNNNPKSYKFPQSNVTGIKECLLISQTFKMLPYFIPNAKKYVLVIEDSVSGDIVLKENLNSEFPPYEKVATLKSEKFSEWKKFLKKHENEIDFVLVPVYLNLKDDTGNLVKPKEVMEWIINNISKPPIGALGFNIEDGALLGVVDTGTKQGKAASKYAIKLLTEKGITPSDLPIIGIEKGELYINEETAKKYNITIPDWVDQFAYFVK